LSTPEGGAAIPSSVMQIFMLHAPPLCEVSFAHIASIVEGGFVEML